MLDLFEFRVSGHEQCFILQGSNKSKTIGIGNTEPGLIFGRFKDQLVGYGKDSNVKAFHRSEAFDLFPVSKGPLRDADDFSIVYSADKHFPAASFDTPENFDDLPVPFLLLKEPKNCIAVK
jgi:hypothetical protein